MRQVNVAAKVLDGLEEYVVECKGTICSNRIGASVEEGGCSIKESRQEFMKVALKMGKPRRQRRRVVEVRMKTEEAVLVVETWDVREKELRVTREAR